TSANRNRPPVSDPQATPPGELPFFAQDPDHTGKIGRAQLNVGKPDSVQDIAQMRLRNMEGGIELAIDQGDTFGHLESARDQRLLDLGGEKEGGWGSVRIVHCLALAL